MADYGGASITTQRGGLVPNAPMPQGLNPRLLLLRDHLAECEKALFELRARLGISEPPTPSGNKPLEEPNNAASVTMDLLARSGRLLELLRSTQDEIC